MTNRHIRPLPTEIEDINAEWLTRALSANAPGAEVLDFEISSMIRGTCSKIFINLSLNEAAKQAGIPEKVVLKGGFEPHSRSMGYMHEKEVRVYRDIAPELKLRRPECYFADYDEEQSQGIVIMEDLVARGVTFCNPLEPQSFQQVAHRLSELARYHAETWDTPEFASGGKWEWVEDTLDNMRMYFDHYLAPDVWQSFVSSPRGAAASIRFHPLDWMDESLNRMAKFAAQLPHTILHGDTHLGNLYIDTDGTPGFFDSLAGRAPAMQEIAYHLACALDLADRPKWEGALIQHYLSELRRHGVDAPIFDDAFHQYQVFLAFGYCIFIINEAVFQSEAVNTAYTARFSAAMLEHKTIELLKEISP